MKISNIAQRNSLSREEIFASLIQMTVCAGSPAALNKWFATKEVLARTQSVARDA